MAGSGLGTGNQVEGPATGGALKAAGVVVFSEETPAGKLVQPHRRAAGDIIRAQQRGSDGRVALTRYLQPPARGRVYRRPELGKRDLGAKAGAEDGIVGHGAWERVRGRMIRGLSHALSATNLQKPHRTTLP